MERSYSDNAIIHTCRKNNFGTAMCKVCIDKFTCGAMGAPPEMPKTVQIAVSARAVGDDAILRKPNVDNFKYDKIVIDDDWFMAECKTRTPVTDKCKYCELRFKCWTER